MAQPQPEVVVLVSANAEWRALRGLYPSALVQESPFGEWFYPPERAGMRTGNLPPYIFFQGGWGKVSAAASTQYVIDRWHPRLLINLGTCGGFEGLVERGTIILARRTVVYDIYEQMGDAQSHIDHYTTEIDLSWLEGRMPPGVLVDVLISADRDLVPEELNELHQRFGARAGDWESGAIAWVAQRNKVRCLILRGVSDLVGACGGEAYGDLELFHQSALEIMRRLVEQLPAWLRV